MIVWGGRSTMRVTHPDDLAEHLAYEHHLGVNALDASQEVLEIAHQQRHEGFGNRADHPADHGHREGGFRWGER